MDRVFESGAAASPPSAPASPSTGYATAGNPRTAVSATKPGPWWYHMVTEELRGVITAAGLTPNHANLTQVRDAIQSMIVGAQKAVITDGATFEASVSSGEVVRWDSANSRYDEAVADGTANNLAVGIADVTGGRVYLYGECTLSTGLTPGARYYLDPTTPGALTTTAPADAVQVGIAKSATVLFVDIDAAIAAQAQSVPVRQTVLSGSVDANGQANFLSAGTGLAVNLAATAVPLSIAFAAGFGANGALDYVGRISADAASAWSGLPASSTVYLYIDRNPSTGALTYGYSTLPPIYGAGITKSTVNGQHTYRIDEGVMYVGNGSTASAVRRVFAGEADTGASSVSAVRTYSLSGLYVSPETAVPAGLTAVILDHNLGLQPRGWRIYAVCKTAEAGWQVGDVIISVRGGNGTYAVEYNPAVRRNQLFWKTPSSPIGGISYSTGGEVSLTPSSWKYLVHCERGW